MVKIYYAGHDPSNHSNFTKFPVASVKYDVCNVAEASAKFLAIHPELFEVGIEVGGRKFNLATGMVPIEI